MGIIDRGPEEVPARPASATCLMCALDATLTQPSEIDQLIAEMTTNAVAGPVPPPQAGLREALANHHWVVLVGTFVHPPAWCHWSIFGDDDLDAGVRAAITHHLEVAVASGVDRRRALAFSVAPYSHARRRLETTLDQFQAALRGARPPGDGD